AHPTELAGQEARPRMWPGRSARLTSDSASELPDCGSPLLEVAPAGTENLAPGSSGRAYRPCGSCAGGRYGDPLRCAPAVTVACQRDEQLRPLRSAVSAPGDGAGPPGR